MSGLTRGPLGAEVYWRRRMIVLGIALLLVLGLARALSLGSDARDTATDPSPGRAAQAGAAISSSPAATDAPTSATPTPSTPAQVRKAKRQQRKAKKAEAEAAAAAASQAAVAALPEAQGPCSDTDVVITPSVPSPVAGSDVIVDLDLRTRFSPACSWSVSPDTVALKITSGPDDIWSSQDCPAAIPVQDVTLRRAVPTVVQVTWNAKRSDETCSGRTDWADAGFYHVLAAALAGEPTDVQFELTLPSAPQVTRTAEPKATKKTA